LTEVAVKDGKLRYVWHTERKWDDDKTGKGDRSNFENYDRIDHAGLENWLPEP
jgi:hypothetical protein